MDYDNTPGESPPVREDERPAEPATMLEAVRQLRLQQLVQADVLEDLRGELRQLLGQAGVQRQVARQLDVLLQELPPAPLASNDDVLAAVRQVAGRLDSLQRQVDQLGRLRLDLQLVQQPPPAPQLEARQATPADVKAAVQDLGRDLGLYWQPAGAGAGAAALDAKQRLRQPADAPTTERRRRFA